MEKKENDKNEEEEEDGERGPWRISEYLLNICQTKITFRYPRWRDKNVKDKFILYVVSSWEGEIWHSSIESYEKISVTILLA